MKRRGLYTTQVTLFLGLSARELRGLVHAAGFYSACCNTRAIHRRGQESVVNMPVREKDEIEKPHGLEQRRSYLCWLDQLLKSQAALLPSAKVPRVYYNINHAHLGVQKPVDDVQSQRENASEEKKKLTFNKMETCRSYPVGS